MPRITVILLALLASGCAVYEQPAATVAGGVSRAELDAINAEAACKAQAKTLVQIARCERR